IGSYTERLSGGCLRASPENLRKRYGVRRTRYASNIAAGEQYAVFSDGTPPVELLYVLLVIVLTALTIGFLMICDRLGRR
ncbi:MAG: hypothetical protein ABWX83_02085, partial [Luteibacter sp.]